MSDFDQPLLSTGQAARLLGIHPSTVKRWFDEPARGEGTRGGHRRIPLELVLAEGEARGHPSLLQEFDGDSGSVWYALEALDGGDFEPLLRLFYRWLKAGRAARIGKTLRYLGSDRPLSPGVLDGAFGGCMNMVGEAWEEGRLRVGEERAASREVGEALLALIAEHGRGAPAPRGDGPIAVVGAMEGDMHSLGPLLVRALLVLRGWTVEYLSADVPIEEFVATQKTVGADLVCVSFTPPLGPPDVRRCVQVISGLMDRSGPFALAVGGAGSAGADLPDDATPFTALFQGESLVELDGWVDRLNAGASS